MDVDPQGAARSLKRAREDGVRPLWSYGYPTAGYGNAFYEPAAPALGSYPTGA